MVENISTILTVQPHITLNAKPKMKSHRFGKVNTQRIYLIKNKYSCINTGCSAVFGQWVSIKLKFLAILGFTLVAICMETVAIGFYIWRQLSNRPRENNVAQQDHRMVNIGSFSHNHLYSCIDNSLQLPIIT